MRRPGLAGSSGFAARSGLAGNSGLAARLRSLPLHLGLTVSYTAVIAILAVVFGGIYGIISTNAIESAAASGARTSADSVASAVAEAVRLENRAGIRAQANLAAAIVDGIRSDTPGEAGRTAALRFLSVQRVGDSGFFYVVGGDGEIVWHPQPDLVGESVDPPTARALEGARGNPKGMFIDFGWRGPRGALRTKAGYVTYMEGWDWHIVAGDYSDGLLDRLPPAVLRNMLNGNVRGDVAGAALYDGADHLVAASDSWTEGLPTAADLAAAREDVIPLPGPPGVQLSYLAASRLPRFDGTVALRYRGRSLSGLYSQYLLIVITSSALALILVAAFSRFAARIVTAPVRSLALRFAGTIDRVDSGRAGSHAQHALQTDGDMKSLILAQLRTLVRLEYETRNRKDAEKELRIAENVFTHTGQGICVTDPDGRILRVNPAFEAITGYHQGEVEGHTTALLRSDRHDNDFYEEMWKGLVENGAWSGEIWNRRKNGEVYPELLAIRAVYAAPSDNDESSAAERNVESYVAVFHDISELKASQEKLHHLATHDPLTNLANRQQMNEMLAFTLRQGQRDGTSTAVLFLDVDNFKDVNDSHGHHAGDTMLKWLARRLTYQLRDEDLVARFGGDEFVIVLPRVAHAEDVSLVARRLLAAAREPYSLAGQRIRPSVSIGIAVAGTENGNGEVVDAATLLRDADAAMYEAKRSGKNDYCFHNASMNASAHRRIAMQGEVTKALSDQEFVVFFQPILDIQSGRVCAAEALVRRRDHGRIVPPGEFLPYIENSNLMVRLDQYVLSEVCRAVRDTMLLPSDFYVTVNVGAFAISSPAFADRFKEIVEQHSLDPESIRVEVTETAAVKSFERARTAIESLRGFGFRVYLDDFGTGYASIRYLKEFGVDAIKLDRSYIADVERSDPARSLVDGFVKLAAGLGLSTVIEGIESEAQLLFAKEVGASMAQGFHVGRPVPFAELQSSIAKTWELGAGGSGTT